MERQVIEGPSYKSFLIRLWREPASEQPEQTAHWHGELEHIQNGHRWTFDSLDHLFDLIRLQVEGSEPQE